MKMGTENGDMCDIDKWPPKCHFCSDPYPSIYLTFYCMEGQPANISFNIPSCKHQPIRCHKRICLGTDDDNNKVWIGCHQAVCWARYGPAPLLPLPLPPEAQVTHMEVVHEHTQECNGVKTRSGVNPHHMRMGYKRGTNYRKEGEQVSWQAKNRNGMRRIMRKHKQKVM